tara:strand:+ start:3259 stop:3597 length:339 start_codon:yes stop_codon:yes gene_type:complete
MKKIFIPIIALLGFNACQDCKDCTANTDVTVLVETFNPITATSTTLSQAGIFVTPTAGNTDLESQFLPVAYGEFCGSELKDYDGKSVTSTVTIGDSATTLYTYTWTEKYDCK